MAGLCACICELMVRNFSWHVTVLSQGCVCLWALQSLQSVNVSIMNCFYAALTTDRAAWARLLVCVSREGQSVKLLTGIDDRTNVSQCCRLSECFTDLIDQLVLTDSSINQQHVSLGNIQEIGTAVKCEDKWVSRGQQVKTKMSVYLSQPPSPLLSFSLCLYLFKRVIYSGH